MNMVPTYFAFGRFIWDWFFKIRHGVPSLDDQWCYLKCQIGQVSCCWATMPFIPQSVILVRLLFLFSFCLKRKEGSIFDLQAMHKTGFITVQNLCRTRRNLTSIKEKNIRACYKELFVSLIQHSNLHYNTLLTLSYRRMYAPSPNPPSSPLKVVQTEKLLIVSGEKT